MYTSILDKNGCLKIKELGIKRNFRGLREGKFRPRIQIKTEASMKNGLNHYPKPIQYTGRAKTQDSF